MVLRLSCCCSGRKNWGYPEPLKSMLLEFLGCRQISQIFFYSLKNNDNLSLIFQVVTLLFRYESRIVINHIA